MVSKESQMALDNLASGYVQMVANIPAEVTELGNVRLNKEFSGYKSINIDTARSGSDLVLLLVDDRDPLKVVEEVYADLGILVERIMEIDASHLTKVDFAAGQSLWSHHPRSVQERWILHSKALDQAFHRPPQMQRELPLLLSPSEPSLISAG